MEINNSQTLSKLDETHAFTDSKGSPNSEQNKFKDTLPDIVKLHETQGIEKKGDWWSSG